MSNLLEFSKFTCANWQGRGSWCNIFTVDFQTCDKMPHKRLISKVKAHGFGGNIVQWIKGLLEDREQRVIINDSCWHWSKVLSGVPQRSVLGSLLFVIYVNGVDSSIISELSKFTNDSKVFSVVLTGADIKGWIKKLA